MITLIWIDMDVYEDLEQSALQDVASATAAPLRKLHELTNL